MILELRHRAHERRRRENADERSPLLFGQPGLGVVVGRGEGRHRPTVGVSDRNAGPRWIIHGKVFWSEMHPFPLQCGRKIDR